MNDFWKLPKETRKQVQREKRRLQDSISFRKYRIGELEPWLEGVKKGLAEDQKAYEKLCKEYNLPL